jgi:hypothetical protein
LQAAPLVAAFLALLLAGCSDPPAVDAVAAQAEAAALTGVVVDNAIRPVAGAQVRLPALDNGTTTAADGTFRFDGLAPGAVALEVSKPGYITATLTATVGGDLVRVQLEPSPSGIPYVVALSFEGFIDCGTSHFAACGAPDRGSELACQNTGQCHGDVTNDDFDVEYALTGPPRWVQSEVTWSNTQPLGDTMFMIHFARSEEERARGTDGRGLGEVQGPSPLMGHVNGTVAGDEDIGIGSNLVIGVYGGPPSAIGCPVGNPPCYVGLVLQQRFRIVTHAFYGYEPPAGWLFSAEGKVPDPPA